MMEQLDIGRITARLKHLLIAERLRNPWAMHGRTKRPFIFTARSMRAVFGHAHRIEDPDLRALTLWSNIPDVPAEHARLGPPFSEPLRRDDTEHLLRRLEYLFLEEDLRMEVMGCRAMIELRHRPWSEVLAAYIDGRCNPVRRAVIRHFGLVRGVVSDLTELDVTDDELFFSRIRAKNDEYPGMLRDTDDERIETFREAGLISNSWRRPEPSD